MRALQHLPLLLAEQEQQAETAKSALPNLLLLAAVVGVILFSFWFGKFLNRKLRMPKENSWRLGMIFCSLLLAILIIVPKPPDYIVPISWGVDLRGGYYLVYEYEDAEDDADDKTDELITALSRRLNPSGTSEIVIRKYGRNQVEIIIPKVDQIEIERLKQQITTAGALEFLMVADKKHTDLVDFLDDERNKDQIVVRDDEGRRVGKWMLLARDKDPDTGEIAFTYQVRGWEYLRDRATKERITGPVTNDYEGDVEILMYTGSIDYDDGEERVAQTSVTGDDIRSCYPSRDERNQPCVAFNMKAAGAAQMGDLTGKHLPNKTQNFYRHLGIVLDNHLISAPQLETTISDRGRITGQFSVERVEFLVNIIKAGGELPTALNPKPLSENQMGALLGQDTIEKGKFAIGASVLVVLVFVAVYYRFAGIVACLALIANMVLIVALMILVKGTFTLPGLAGLVLTVGMSVDANVLIFERIREEMAKGSALRMAIRNGFSRATTTIVDANVTTLITAMVLYAIGTDQIRGFAVTLILGILMSMYTAIFCSRVIFDIAERAMRLNQLTMMRILGSTAIDFIGKRRLAAVFSIVVITVGLVAVVRRGDSLLDIDFRGGTSVTVELLQPMENRAMRDRLDQMRDDAGKQIPYSLYTVNLTGYDKDTIWKINTSLSSDPDSDVDSIEVLSDEIKSVFKKDAGGSLLRAYNLSYKDLKKVDTQPPDDTKKDDTKKDDTKKDDTKKDDTKKDDTKKDDTKKDDTKKDDTTSPNKQGTPDKDKNSKKQSQRVSDKGYRFVALSIGAAPTQDEAKKGEAKKSEAKKEEAKKGEAKKEEAKKREAKKEEAKKSEAKKEDAKKSEAKKGAKKETTGPAGIPGLPGSGDQQPKTPVIVDQTQAHIILGDPNADDEAKRPVDGGTLRNNLVEAAEKLNIPLLEEDFQVEPQPGTIDSSVVWTIESGLRLTEWLVTVRADQATTKKILDEVQQSFAERPVFHSSNSFGKQVSGNMQRMALEALLASLLGIIAYIWIRFQKVVFGLAAVVALLHDVLVTLGAIALSAYVAGALGFLKIEEFKISLPVVAAFLTIIGYSLNDTIVVFDRIREVRGKSPDLTGAMINTSINQTLSRTLLTLLTTLIVVGILYWFGGSGIHGFAFALVIGVIVGTYSSIFVASPVLLWMMRLTTQSQTKKAA